MKRLACSIKVLGKVNSESDIPAGTYNNGDAYIVGSSSPYIIYSYVKNQGVASPGSFIKYDSIIIEDDTDTEESEEDELTDIEE